MRLTLIALLLAGVAGCDPTPDPEFEATLKAAEQGDADAQFYLGEIYESGIHANGEDVPQNYAEAMKWWLKAAEQGNAEAKFKLGLMYYDGDGVPQDYAEAMKWYRKAAEQGDAVAQLFLGYLYFEGEGVPKDDVEAYVWFSIAAINTNNESDPDDPDHWIEEAKGIVAREKARLTPNQLIAAEKRIEELTEQINANKAK